MEVTIFQDRVTVVYLEIAHTLRVSFKPDYGLVA